MKGARGESRPGRRIPLEAVVLAVPYVPIALGTADRPGVMWAWVVGALAVRLLLLRRQGDIWVLAAGVLLGGGSDMFTVSRDIYAYTVTDVLPLAMPAWMLVMWGHIFLFIRSFFWLPPLRTRLPTVGPFRDGRILLLDMATVVLLRSAFVGFADTPGRAAAAGAGILVVRFLIVRPSQPDLLLAIVAVLVGSWVEGRLIAAGLYSYREGVLFGVPAWLALWWFFAIPFLNRAATFVEATHRARTGGVLGLVHLSDTASSSTRGVAT